MKKRKPKLYRIEMDLKEGGRVTVFPELHPDQYAGFKIAAEAGIRTLTIKAHHEDNK